MYEQNTSMMNTPERNTFLLPAMVEGDFSSDEIAEDADGLQMMSFQRVKIPAGGALQFEIPTEDPDNPDYARTLEGVVLYNHSAYLNTTCTFEEVFRHTDTPPMQFTGRSVSEVAYSRSDYDGHRWWTTWHDGPGKKAVPELVKEIDDFQNALFKLPAFKTLNTMRRFCRYAQATSEATEFNLYSETDHLYIWIRMITRFWDYNVYVHYYDKAAVGGK